MRVRVGDALMQAIDCVGTLLSRIGHRPAMGELRVVLLLPDWDDYVSAASYDVRTQISPITCAP